MAETPGAGMDHDRDISFLESENIGGYPIKNFFHFLDLNEMITGAKRPDLGPTPFNRFVTDNLKTVIAAQNRSRKRT